MSSNMIIELTEEKQEGQPQSKVPDLKHLRLDSLTNTQVFAYGLGHFLNDATATLWFNFLLYYLVEKDPIIENNTTEAGALVGLIFLIGQVVDGLATPLVGILSDKYDTRCGKRMPWYYVGIVFVAGSFTFMFQPCRLCQAFGRSELMTFANYAFFGIIFNIGWAMCQVSHMSLVPSLTLSRGRRDMLNSMRSFFTFVANLSILALAAVLFSIIEDEKQKYQLLAYIGVTIGFVACLVFVYMIREKLLVEGCRRLASEYREAYQYLQETGEISPDKNDKKEATERKLSQDTTFSEASSPDRKNEIEESLIARKIDEIMPKKNFSWYHWLSSGQFWLYGGVYMAARIYCNITASMLLFYLEISLRIGENAEDVEEDKTPFSFALIPMLIYISSSVVTTRLPKLYSIAGRKKMFSIAAIVAIGTALSLHLLPSSLSTVIYAIVLPLGFAQSVILNTSIAYISEVIGTRTENGAFVFGAYSLFEKIANGVLLWFILDSQDVKSKDSDEYIRFCIALLPLSAVLFGWVCILFGKAKDYEVSGKGGHNSDALVHI